MPIGPAIKLGGDLLKLVPKMILGAKQRKRARNLQRSEGFDYISPELLKNQALAEQGAYSARSFGQGADEAAIRKQAAGGRYAAGQTGSVAKRLAATSTSTSGYLDRLSRLREKGRGEREGRVGRLMATNVMVGNVKAENERRFQATKEALLGASQQNIYGGVSQLGDTLSQNAGMFGSKVTPTTYKKGFGGFSNPNPLLNQANSPYSSKFTDF